MSLEYQVNVDQQLAAIRQRLGALEGEAETVLKAAIRQTANAVRKRMLETARERYAEQDPSLLANKTLKLSQKGDGMTVTLRAHGAANDLAKFEHQPGPNVRAPVSAHVLAENALKQIGGQPKPFTATFRNGKIAILRRVPGETYRSGRAYAARKLLGWDLTRVEKLVTVSTPQMLHSDEAVDAAYAQFSSDLPAAIEKQIAKILKKGASA